MKGLKQVVAWGKKLLMAWILLAVVMSAIAVWLNGAARQAREAKARRTPAVVVTADGRRVAVFVDPRTGDRYELVPEEDFERARAEYGLVTEAEYLHDR